MFLNLYSENPVVVGKKKRLMVEKSKKKSPKTFKHSVLTQNETESNWCSIALAANEVRSVAADHAKIHKYIGVYIRILSNKTCFSDNCFNNVVTLVPS